MAKNQKAVKSAAPKTTKILEPEKTMAAKRKTAKAPKPAAADGPEQLISSEVVFEGPLFRVLRDRLIEPGGSENTRDIVRHNGSVVILAIDSKNKRIPGS